MVTLSRETISDIQYLFKTYGDIKPASNHPLILALAEYIADINETRKETSDHP